LVHDDAFHDLQMKMVNKLRKMVENVEVAFDVLTTSCTRDLQTIVSMMLSARFKPQSEPHLRDMFSSIRVV